MINLCLSLLTLVMLSFPSRAVVLSRSPPNAIQGWTSHRKTLRTPRIPAFSQRCSLWVKMGGGIGEMPGGRPSLQTHN